MAYDLCVQCPQQQGLTIKFYWTIRNNDNSLYFLREEVFGAPMTNNMRRGIPAVGFLVGNLRLLG